MGLGEDPSGKAGAQSGGTGILGSTWQSAVCNRAPVNFPELCIAPGGLVDHKHKSDQVLNTEKLLTMDLTVFR